MERTLKIIVSGRVQGVFFRKSTLDKALSLNIRGSVQNLKNGEVEIIAQGIDYDLYALKEWTKIGSQASRVDSVRCEIFMTSRYANFKILR